jgi:SAM-dependent methyltransferase
MEYSRIFGYNWAVMSGPVEKSPGVPAIDVAQLARRIGDDWQFAPYYDLAEQENWLAPFWAENGPFVRLFNALDLTSVLELGCGHGRHSEKIRLRAKRVILVDINSGNIKFCRERFKNEAHFEFFVTDGFRFDSVETDSCTSIFSYDAMVHFDSDVVRSYLQDTARVLRPGGRALFHHSNYTGARDGNPHDSPHWRNFMNEALFHHYSIKAGLNRLAFEILTWGDYPAHDCLTLLEKPHL